MITVGIRVTQQKCCTLTKYIPVGRGIQTSVCGSGDQLAFIHTEVFQLLASLQWNWICDPSSVLVYSSITPYAGNNGALQPAEENNVIV